jgi:hypothetical protein
MFRTPLLSDMSDALYCMIFLLLVLEFLLCQLMVSLRFGLITQDCINFSVRTRNDQNVKVEICESRM